MTLSTTSSATQHPTDIAQDALISVPVSAPSCPLLLLPVHRAVVRMSLKYFALSERCSWTTGSFRGQPIPGTVANLCLHLRGTNDATISKDGRWRAVSAWNLAPTNYGASASEFLLVEDIYISEGLDMPGPIKHMVYGMDDCIKSTYEPANDCFPDPF